MIQGFQQHHFAALLANKNQIFGEVKSNIDKNQKHQKHYFDIQNEMPGNVVKKGDIVIKEKQKDKSRKDGKLSSSYNESTYTVVNIHHDANLILKNTNTNEILKTPGPQSHVKKYLKRKMEEKKQDMQDVEVDMKPYLDIMSDEVDSKKQRMSDSDVKLLEESYLRTIFEDFDITMDGNSNIENKANHRVSTAKSGMDGVETTSLTKNVVSANIQVKKETCHQDMSSAKARVGAVATTSSSRNAENEQVKKLMNTKKLEGSVSDKSRLQIDDFSDSDNMLSEDDDILVMATKVTPPQPFVFSPLTAKTQVEVGPLLNISQFSMPKVQIFWKR